MDQATLRWINFAFEVLQALAALFALWLASGIALEQFVAGGSEELDADFEPGDADDVNEAASDGIQWQPRFGRGLTIVLWLVLGGFFYLPLTDLITGLRTAVFLGIGWNEMGLSPAFNSFGSLPQNYYFLFTLILLIVVYGFVLILGRRAFADRPGSLFFDLQLSSIERAFMLLGAAGLVHFLINNLLITLIWVDLPNQTAQPTGGALPFLAPAIVGLLLVLLLVFWMNSALLREEIQMDEDWEDEEEGEEYVEYELLEDIEDEPAEPAPPVSVEESEMAVEEAIEMDEPADTDEEVEEDDSSTPEAS